MAVYGNLMQINLTNRQQKSSPKQGKSMCVGRRIAVYGNLMQGNLNKICTEILSYTEEIQASVHGEWLFMAI